MTKKNPNFTLKGDEKIASSVITVSYHLRSERGKNERKITSQKIKGRSIFMHFFPDACFMISTIAALLCSYEYYFARILLNFEEMWIRN